MMCYVQGMKWEPYLDKNLIRRLGEVPETPCVRAEKPHASGLARFAILKKINELVPYDATIVAT